MMGTTHFAAGIAAAIAAVRPETASQCLPAMLGGALGSVLCDIDTLRSDGKNDAVVIQFTAAAVAALSLALDYFLKTGLCSAILAQPREHLLAGAAAFAMLWTAGFFSSHRGFTHSILAGAMFSLAAWLLCPPAALPFAAAYASHLALDLTNKKGLRLLFPLKTRLCLGLFYADKAANILFLQFGILGAIFFAMYSMGMLF